MRWGGRWCYESCVMLRASDRVFARLLLTWLTVFESVATTVYEYRGELRVWWVTRLG